MKTLIQNTMLAALLTVNLAPAAHAKDAKAQAPAPAARSVAPAPAPQPVAGPIRFTQILTGNYANIPSRTLYKDALDYTGYQLAHCAHFDATDEMTAERSFRFAPEAQITAGGEVAKGAKAVNYGVARYMYKGCSDGQLVYVAPNTMMPIVSTRRLAWGEKGSDVVQSQSVSISFERFLKGGAGMRLKFEVGYGSERNNYLNDSAPMFLAKSNTLTWEGDFFVDRCETDTGASFDMNVPKLNSVSDILASQDEIMHPTFARCTFRSNEMITRDVPFWRGGHGEIFPRLKNIAFTVHPFYANVKFTALNGVPFGVERVRAVRQGNADSAQLMASTQHLMDILNSVIPVLVNGDRDSRLPSVVNYLRRNRTEIQRTLADIDTMMQNPEIPFDAIFNVTLSLNRAYQFLDQALGLVSSQDVTFARALELAQ